MRVWKQWGAVLVCAVLVAFAAVAQEKQEKKVERVFDRRAEQVRVMAGGPEAFSTFEFISAEGFGGSPVKGAPYSGELVTETTQMLSDGNRIHRRNATLLFRDSEGRTRRESTLEAIGPWASSGSARKVISINDPVSGSNFSLDPESKSARKMGGLFFGAPGVAMAREAGKDSREIKVQVEALNSEITGIRVRGPEVAEGSQIRIMRESGPVPATVLPETVWHQRQKGESEDLGVKTIEGVQAKGTRTTYTIPAGEVGNDLPIAIVNETWYSPELQMTVYSSRRDPRSGETVTKLIGLRREEPPKSLFEIPSEYSIQDLRDSMKLRRREEL